MFIYPVQNNRKYNIVSFSRASNSEFEQKTVTKYEIQTNSSLSEACYSSLKTRASGFERGQMVTDKGEIFNRHNTKYCRPDMNWTSFEKILRKKYPNPDDVNFVVYACSYGQEPYTLSILLNKIYGHPVKISAFDISQDVIDTNIENQKDGVELSIKDVNRIHDVLKLKDYKSFSIINGNKCKIDKTITDAVEFKRSNILDDIDLIDKNKPTVLMARNMWPYVQFFEYNRFCKKLNDVLHPNSIFVIGLYDYEGENVCVKSSDFPKILSKNGFKSIDGNIFTSMKYFKLIFAKK